MSFQAYIDNIQARTGKTNAGEIVKWLKEDFDLGHGHSMAIHATFKGMKK